MTYINNSGMEASDTSRQFIVCDYGPCDAIIHAHGDESLNGGWVTGYDKQRNYLDFCSQDHADICIDEQRFKSVHVL
ncbi:hypothetical protein SEA_CAMERICO_6 [Gordonia phage Camerico]|nr:hypothetical protein SEA_CAMERICO_6 [Gordonia phage Camerico]